MQPKIEDYEVVTPAGGRRKPYLGVRVFGRVLKQGSFDGPEQADLFAEALTDAQKRLGRLPD